jgi:hypothetical protein
MPRLPTFRARLDEAVPHSADVLAEQDGTDLLKSRWRIVARPDDGLAFVDSQQRAPSRSPTIGIKQRTLSRLSPRQILRAAGYAHRRGCSSARIAGIPNCRAAALATLSSPRTVVDVRELLNRVPKRDRPSDRPLMPAPRLLASTRERSTASNEQMAGGRDHASLGERGGKKVRCAAKKGKQR